MISEQGEPLKAEKLANSLRENACSALQGEERAGKLRKDAQFGLEGSVIFAELLVPLGR